MTRIKVRAVIGEDHELSAKVPEDLPTGPVDVVIEITPVATPALPTIGDFLESEFYGMWRDRTDIKDSAEFARNLRQEAWKRARDRPSG